MKNVKLETTVLGVYGLPVSYAGKSYEDTGLAKVRKASISETISRAPNKGTLVIQGTAAPIINQFIKGNRKVRGLDFVTLSSSAFEDHPFPVADVVVLYNVGVEVSTNFKISGQVFRKILKFYAERNTLLVIETDLGKMDLRSRYDFNVVNFIKVPVKDEEVWV